MPAERSTPTDSAVPATPSTPTDSAEPPIFPDEQDLQGLPSECQQPAGLTRVLPSHCAELLGEEYVKRFPRSKASSPIRADETEKDDGDVAGEEDTAPSTTFGPSVRRRGRRRLEENSPSRAAGGEGNQRRSRVASLASPTISGGLGGSSGDTGKGAMVGNKQPSEEEAAARLGWRRTRRRSLQSGQVDESRKGDNGREDDGDDHDDGGDDGDLVGTGGGGGRRASAEEREERNNTSLGNGNGNGNLTAPLPFKVRDAQSLFPCLKNRRNTSAGDWGTIAVNLTSPCSIAGNAEHQANRVTPQLIILHHSEYYTEVWS